jgi:hypothetical protein
MTMFGDYYGYDYSQNELAIAEWYKVLSRLDDSELYPCLKAAIAKFPRRPLSPLDVIENFKPTPKSDLIAWEEWKTIQNSIRYPDTPLPLSPMAELALDAIGGIRTISALPQEKLGYSANNFVKLWGMYEESLNNGTVQPPIPKLPEVREIYRAEPIIKPDNPDMTWYHELLEKRMPKHILDAIKKLRAEKSVSNENIQSQSEGFSLLRDSFLL